MTGKDKKESDEARKKREEELDEEIEESFPASDPPASTQPKPSKEDRRR